MSDQTATVEFNVGVLQALDSVVRIAETVRPPDPERPSEDYALVQTLARAAWRECEYLGRRKDHVEYPQELHARVLLSGIAASALFSREWELAPPDCSPGDRFWPAPEGAFEDLREFCRLAREHFLEPGGYCEPEAAAAAQEATRA